MVSPVFQLGLNTLSSRPNWALGITDDKVSCPKLNCWNFKSTSYLKNSLIA